MELNQCLVTKRRSCAHKTKKIDMKITRCYLHRQTPAVKKMPEKLKDVLNDLCLYYKFYQIQAIKLKSFQIIV